MKEVFEANGAKFIAKDDLIVGIVRDQRKDFEPTTSKWIFDNLVQGKAFLDIGHSTGWFSIPISKMGYEVIGFEPLTVPYERAVENMKLNGVEYVLHNLAASDVEGETQIHFNPKVPITSGASLEKSVRPGANVGHYTIKTVRIDDVVNSPVGIMKIDVEGHEIAVLRGAKETIQRDKPKIMLEANDDKRLNELSDWLEGVGYTYELVDGRNMLCETKEK